MTNQHSKKSSTWDGWPEERLRVALVGTPNCFDTRFDQAQLGALRELGFNTIQINIAWGSRGNDEPLNIEDVLGPAEGQPGEREQRWLAEMKRRAKAVKAAGFRCIFHAGVPQVVKAKHPDRETAFQDARERGSVCIQTPEVRERYRTLIARLGQEIPEIDDLLIYTYDQDAWLCSEFGQCPRCRTVPLHERLPDFLLLLRDAWRACRPEGVCWWEPWELSAGQTYALVDRLPVEGFGLMLHGNISEVQLAHRADDWFRNLSRWAGRRGIPVVGELFLTSSNEEVANLLHVACPRLAWEGVKELEALPGVVGIKEYFGVLPERWDPNLLASSAALRGAVSYTDTLEKIVGPFGPAAEALRGALTAMDDAIEAWPWNLCWKYRMTAQKWWWIYEARGGAHVKGHLIDTPAWCSTRRAHFMATEDDTYHPWFYEDSILRWRTAAAYLDQAVQAYDHAETLRPADQPPLGPWKLDAAAMAGFGHRLANWTESTLLCDLMRQESGEKDAWNPKWEQRLEAILEDDVRRAPHENGRAVATELREAWHADKRAFLTKYLNAW